MKKKEKKKFDWNCALIGGVPGAILGGATIGGAIGVGGGAIAGYFGCKQARKSFFKKKKLDLKKEMRV